VSGTHLEPTTNFSFSSKISFRQLWVYYFVAPSLTKGRACNLLYNCFWALPEQSLLGRSPAELRPYFIVSSETPPTWRARFPYLYLPGTGWPSYTPGHWFPFCRLLRLEGLRWRYSNPPPYDSSWSLLLVYSFGTNHTENTTSNSSCMVALFSVQSLLC
jgi:hypothetical protein